ncbi:hypothetical protein QOZ80_2AG0100310 [Eleusine coracana subsp. coracana]|nr:hypothetical protein QOZ80_2AG0100310 [Eleusine coracana subsp. coracana]
MGGSFSAFNKFGLPGLTTATTGQVYERHFKGKKTDKFEDFHIAYIEFCKYFNTVMPGQDFDTPPREKIEEFYNNVWSQQTTNELKREKFFEYMENHVKVASMDDSFFIMAGLAAPAAAVIGKRASGHIPYVKNMRLDLVPNVVFVPVFTLGAIVAATAAQMSRKSAKVEESSAAEQHKEESKKD